MKTFGQWLMWVGLTVVVGMLILSPRIEEQAVRDLAFERLAKHETDFVIFGAALFLGGCLLQLVREEESVEEEGKK